MPTYQTLLFDLDGTLTDPKPGITRSVQYALEQMGIDEPDLERLIPFIGPPLTESFERYYGFGSSKARKAIHFYREYFATTGLYENAVYPGIPELLAGLQQQGLLLIIATSKPTTFAQQILEYFQLEHYFTLIVGSNLDNTRTSKTEIIAHILNEYPHRSKQTTVMVGDRKHDIIGAQNNQIDSIAVCYGYGSQAELERANATHFVQTVEDLSQLLQG